MTTASNSAVGRATLLLWLFALLLVTALASSTDEPAHRDGDTKGGGHEIPDRNTSDLHAKTAVPDGSVTQMSTTPRIQEPNEALMLEMSKQFIKTVAAQRQNTSSSITNFEFKINRIRVLSRNHDFSRSMKGVVYWMYRDHRIHDNWALLYAQKLAIEYKVPLHIIYCRPKKVVDNNYRHQHFIIEGLKQIENECLKMNIQFHFLTGYAADVIPNFVKRYDIGAAVLDFVPLKDHMYVAKLIALAVGSDLPVLQIDTHNIVPTWYVTDKQEYSPGSIRLLFDKKLYEFLTEFPPIIKHPFSGEPKAKPINWEALDKNLEIDRSVLPVHHLKAGYDHAMHVLNVFIKNGLQKYKYQRQDPMINGISNLSPWLNAGHISAQRVLLETLKYNRTFQESVTIFREEILVRRELSDNYCFYNNNYTNFEDLPLWCRLTLNAHRNDTREYVYTREEFEKSLTHDDLWNSANLQMIQEGKVHRFLRPYWAKKILEFSKTPEEAIAIANYLNNKYSIDANDPNGYVGVLWAVTGLHDVQCYERVVFGKIRYMSAMGCRSKFGSLEYIHKYGGKAHVHPRN